MDPVRNKEPPAPPYEPEDGHASESSQHEQSRASRRRHATVYDAVAGKAPNNTTLASREAYYMQGESGMTRESKVKTIRSYLDIQGRSSTRLKRPHWHQTRSSSAAKMPRNATLSMTSTTPTSVTFPALVRASSRRAIYSRQFTPMLASFTAPSIVTAAGGM